MENLGVNLLESDSFCSDIVALFISHVRDCDSCLAYVIGFAIGFFLFIGLIWCIFMLVDRCLDKIIDSSHFKNKYEKLESDYKRFRFSYDNLLDQYNELGIKYAELEKEYYHTCN